MSRACVGVHPSCSAREVRPHGSSPRSSLAAAAQVARGTPAERARRILDDVVTAATAAAIGAQAAALRKTLDTAHAFWAPYAEARGMRYTQGRSGWARMQWPRVDGAVDRIPVALEAGTVRTAHGTFALAVPPAPVRGHLEATRQGWMSRLAVLLGAQDVSVGDPAFDEAFVVKATDEALALELLTPTVRAEMAALGVERLAYDDGSEHAQQPLVLLEVPALVTDAPGLDRLLRTVAEVASVRRGIEPYR